MKNAFYYCLCLSFGALIGWFAEPIHRPHKLTITEQLVKMNDSLQADLNLTQAKLKTLTDSLSQANAE